MGAYDEAEKEALDPKPRSVHEFFTEQLRLKFQTLPREQKELIREATAKGFAWKGEDTQTKYEKLGGMSHFEHAYNEFLKMREIGIDEYRKQALVKMREVLHKLDAQSPRNMGTAQ